MNILPVLLSCFARNQLLAPCLVRYRFLLKLAALCLFSAGTLARLEAQVEALPSTGLSANASYQHTDIDSVDLSSGNVNVYLPLISFPQLGDALKLNFMVRYNQPQWSFNIYSSPDQQNTPTSYGGTWFLAQKQGAAPAGGPLGVDVVRDQGITVRSEFLNYPCLSGGRQIDCAGGPDGGTGPGAPGNPGASGTTYTTAQSVSLRDRSGAVHPLIFSGPSLSGASTVIITSQDGSGWLPQGQNGSAAVFSVKDRQGLRYTPSSLSQYRAGWDITDTHGNRIITTDNGWTDSAGRTIPGTWISGLPEDDPMPGVPASDTSLCDTTATFARTWSVPGKSQPYIFCYTNLSGTTAFNLQTMLGYPAGGIENSWSAPFLTQIVLPNEKSYRFTYDPVFADVTSITFPTGGYVSYVWQTLPQICSYTNPLKRVIQTRTVNDGSKTSSWNYQWTPRCGYDPNSGVVISKPDGNDEWHGSVSNPSVQNGEQERIVYYQGRSGAATSGQAPQGTIKKQVLTTFSIFNSTLRTVNGTPETFRGPPTSVVTTLDDGSVAETDYTLVPNGGVVTFDNPLANVPYQYPNGQTLQCACINYPEIADVKVYDYGQGSHGPLLREAITHYQSFEGTAAANYLAANLIDLPSESDTFDGNGGQAAKSSYTYDESAYSSGNVEGNLTSLARSVDSSHSVTTHISFNSSGMPTQKTDARSTVTAINSYQCSGLFPKQILLASGTSLQQSESFGYDCNTGNLTSFTDANNQQTTYSYADPLSRLKGISYPDGGLYSVSYTDGSRSSVQLTTTTGGQQGDLVQTVSYDGLGKTTSVSISGGATVSTMYDSMGRIAATSNAEASGSSESSWTSFAYDALGRPSLKCNPDNGTPAGQCATGVSYQESTYSGATAVQYDELRNLWTRTSDAMGRLARVSEPDGATTNYSYTALNDLSSVTQSGVTGETSRTRSFRYDWISRLLTASNPETGVICYGVSSGTACSSGYDDNGNLQTKTDARGVVSSYSYDVLNRVLTKSYSSPFSQTSCYAYDGATNGVGRLTAEWTQLGSCPTSVGSIPGSAITRRAITAYDQMGRVKAEQTCIGSMCSARSRSNAYDYDLAGNLLTYMDGRAVAKFTQSYDAAGRFSGVSSSLTDAIHPANLFKIDIYGPVGWMKATMGDPATGVLTHTQTFDNRTRVASHTVTSGVTQ